MKTALLLLLAALPATAQEPRGRWLFEADLGFSARYELSGEIRPPADDLAWALSVPLSLGRVFDSGLIVALQGRLPFFIFPLGNELALGAVAGWEQDWEGLHLYGAVGGGYKAYELVDADWLAHRGPYGRVELGLRYQHYHLGVGVDLARAGYGSRGAGWRLGPDIALGY